MSVYTAITFAPVQGFISKSRKLRDLYGGSFILSYLARTVCNAAYDNKLEVVSPATINLTQGTPNQIIVEGETAFRKEIIEPIFNRAWQKLVEACRQEIEKLVPRDDYGWRRSWNAWGNHAWEFFCAEGKAGESITDVRQKLNEIKRKRNWIGINWMGESSTLSGTDAVAWYGMSSKTHPKEASMGELDDQIRQFYGDLSKALGKGIIAPNEQLSIPELIKRFVTLETIKKRLNDEKLPQIENPETFKDISRQQDEEKEEKKEQQEEQEEESRWTGWFQGDGDKIGDYLQSLVAQGKEERVALKEFSTAMIKWGSDFHKTLPVSPPHSSPKKEGRIIYAGGDDFLGVLYRNYNPKLTGKKCLEWFYTFPDIWSRHKIPITVSIGFVWAGAAVPQRDVLEHCREAEQSAKANGRDRLAIRILFNSGNHLEWVCPWWCLETILSTEVNWTNFYRDVAVLESRHGFYGQTENCQTEHSQTENCQTEVAISLFNHHFNQVKNQVNLEDSTYWFNNAVAEPIDNLRKGKTGILGERNNYEEQEKINQNKVNKALNNWVINLSKVGFHLCKDSE